jgi:hypothetical protein
MELGQVSGRSATLVATARRAISPPVLRREQGRSCLFLHGFPSENLLVVTAQMRVRPNTEPISTRRVKREIMCPPRVRLRAEFRKAIQ